MLLLFLSIHLLTTGYSQSDTTGQAQWSEPYKIGDVVNPEYEYAPIITGSDTLFFTRRKPNFGIWKDTSYSLIIASVFSITPNGLAMGLRDFDGVLTAERYLSTEMGDCLYYFSSLSQKYLYVATWVGDHYVYNPNGEHPIHFVRIKSDELFDSERSILEPVELSIMYWGARAPHPNKSQGCNAEIEYPDSTDYNDTNSNDIFIDMETEGSNN